jgi:hypothetical protein
MKFRAMLLIFAVLAGTLRAQTPAAKPGSVEGTVTNSVTGEPVKKAVVTLTDPKSQSNRTAITDAAGRFQFDSVAPNAYFLAADRDGFMAPRQGPRQAAQQITVAEEQHVQDVAIKLLPLGVVTGHVLDDDGEPIIRAGVAVLRYFYNSGRKQLSAVEIAQSNDLGEFEAIDLQPGRYYFQATAAPIRSIPPHTRWSHPEEAYPPTFYPNGSEAGQATATEVAPGAHVTNIDFRLRKMPAYHIRGTVEGGQRALPGTLQLQAVGTGVRSGGPRIAYASDGTFDIGGIVSGAYDLTIPHPQNGLPFGHQTVTVADADVNNVVLTLALGSPISGRVTVDGALIDKGGMQIALEQLQRFTAVSASWATDGSFTFPAMAPDVYQLSLSNPPSGKYVKSIRLGDQEIKNRIDLSSGSAAPLNIVLGTDGAEMDGNVQNASGQPAAITQVTLAPEGESDGRSDLFKRAFTDASGNFRIKDVAPGAYKVFAWESDPDGSTQSAEFRKPFEERSVAVTIGPKDKASVQLSVITADDVEKESSKLP